MDASKKRPWYRLHVGTILVVALVSLEWSQFAFPQMMHVRWNPYGIRRSVGWPLSSFKRAEYGQTPMAVDSVSLAVNCLFAAAAICSIGVVVEKLERSHWRFRLSSAMIAVTIIAVLLGFWQWEGVLGSPLLPEYPELREYIPLHNVAFQSRVIILVGLACLTFSVCSLAWALSASFLARIRWVARDQIGRRRPAPAKVGTDGSPPQ